MRKTTARIPIETKCLSCGKKVTETLGRFAKKSEPVCPHCGGKLDREPLRQFALATVKEFKAALEFDMKLLKLRKK